MKKLLFALAAIIACYLPPVSAKPPSDQFRFSEKTLKSLVADGYEIVGYSKIHDPVSNILGADFMLQKKGSAFLCSDNYRYKAVTRELACYELVEPFNASER